MHLQPRFPRGNRLLIRDFVIAEPMFVLVLVLVLVNVSRVQDVIAFEGRVSQKCILDFWRKQFLAMVLAGSGLRR
jgi:hypothetical protein